MPTDRAKRLAWYLEKKLDWSVNETLPRTCTNSECCHIVFKPEDRFCSECGTKLPKTVKDTEAYDELETAIAYALREGKTSNRKGEERIDE